jgi:hypothetical protein
LCRCAAGKVECSPQIALLRLKAVDRGMNMLATETQAMLSADVSQIYVARVVVIAKQKKVRRLRIASDAHVPEDR